MRLEETLVAPITRPYPGSLSVFVAIVLTALVVAPASEGGAGEQWWTRASLGAEVQHSESFGGAGMCYVGA
jgi:hypothetical protein